MPTIVTIGAMAARGFGWLFTTGPNKLYAWGWNGFGQLGLRTGDITTRSSPVQVGLQPNWKYPIAGGYHSGCIKSDGTLWMWGYGSSGQLGGGNTNSTESPVQVGTLTNWKLASGGFNFNIAIKTDGTLWAWGQNLLVAGVVDGMLGTGNTIDRSSPVQIGALTTWDTVSCAGYHSIALKTDGTIWTWGTNVYGELGLGDTTNRSSPVQVGALTTWAYVAASRNGNNTDHTLAIKTDGTLWACGLNQLGQLGLGDTTSRSSPVQVGALTDWNIVYPHISCTHAIKTNGSLWAWGDGTDGGLGDGTTVSKSSPVQIGSLTTWAYLSGGEKFTLAIKTDGTLWAWGYNDTYAALGNGNTINTSSPVQIGTATDWINPIASGQFHSIAVRT